MNTHETGERAARREGKRIQAAREALGLNQAELARRMQMSQEAVSAWERGRSEIPHKHLPQLAAALGMTSLQVHALLERVIDPYAFAELERWASTTARKVAHEYAEERILRLTSWFEQTPPLVLA